MTLKRKVSWLTSLILLCVIILSAATVHAAVTGLELKADKNVVEPGELVTVSVVMNEAVLLENMTSVFQMELDYDPESVTYASHKLASGYEFLDVVISESSPVIKAYWIYLLDLDIDFDMEGEIDEAAVAEMLAAVADDVSNPAGFTRELPAGTVLSVTFTVKDEIDVDELVTSLSNSFTMSVEGAVTNTFSHSYSVKVCTGHTDEDGDNVCDQCGESLGLMGDVNSDGKVNTRDALIVLRYASKKITDTDLDLRVADVNNDGKVNTRDALTILRYASKKITEFPLS